MKKFDFNISDLLPNFWFLNVVFVRQYGLYILAVTVLCTVLSCLLGDVSIMQITSGFFSGLILVGAYVFAVGFRRVYLMSRRIRATGDDEVVQRKSPIRLGSGLKAEIGWLGLTNHAFYFLPVRLFGVGTQKRWHLDDITAYDAADDFALPGGEIMMPVVVRHAAGPVRWILPDANRWYTLFTIQLNPETRKEQAAKSTFSSSRSRIAAPHTQKIKDFRKR